VLAIFSENGFACRNVTREAGALSPLRALTTGAVIKKTYG
jgi:hypothetical protein